MSPAQLNSTSPFSSYSGLRTGYCVERSVDQLVTTDNCRLDSFDIQTRLYLHEACFLSRRNHGVFICRCTNLLDTSGRKNPSSCMISLLGLLVDQHLGRLRCGTVIMRASTIGRYSTQQIWLDCGQGRGGTQPAAARKLALSSV